MAKPNDTTAPPNGTTPSRRRLLAGIAAAPVALALPAIALASKPDTELFAAYNEVVAAYEAFGCQAASNIRPPSASKSRPPQPYQQLQR